MTAIHFLIFPCAFRSPCVHISTYFLHNNPRHSVSVKQNTRLIQQSLFSHTTQSLLSFLLLIYGALLLLTVATVTRHGIGSVTCRQAERKQKSVYLMECEPHFTRERKKWAPLKKIQVVTARVMTCSWTFHRVKLTKTWWRCSNNAVAS